MNTFVRRLVITRSGSGRDIYDELSNTEISIGNFSYKCRNGTDRNTFEMLPAASPFIARNAFMPVAKGMVIEEKNITRVELLFTLNKRTKAFSLCFVLLAAAMQMLCVIYAVKNRCFDAALLIPTGMILFMYALTAAGFAISARIVERAFREALEDGAEN